MIHHCVFVNFRADCDRDERDDIFSSLAQLVGVIPGLQSLSFGPNADFERKSEPYGDGFVAVFADRQSLADYAADPRHVELGARLVANAVGGADGIMVFDVVSS